MSLKIVDRMRAGLSFGGSHIVALYTKALWSKDNTNPGCLVELGYITNTDDLKKQKEKQDDIAKELCEGIKKYYEN